jgi:hypothetical protein
MHRRELTPDDDEKPKAAQELTTDHVAFVGCDRSGEDALATWWITLDVPNVSQATRAAYDPINQVSYAGTASHVGFF